MSASLVCSSLNGNFLIRVAEFFMYLRRLFFRVRLLQYLMKMLFFMKRTFSVLRIFELFTFIKLTVENSIESLPMIFIFRTFSFWPQLFTTKGLSTCQ